MRISTLSKEAGQWIPVLLNGQGHPYQYTRGMNRITPIQEARIKCDVRGYVDVAF